MSTKLSISKTTTSAAKTSADVKKRRGDIFSSRIKANIRTYTMISVLVVIWITFTIVTKGMFLSSRNLALLARQASVTSVLAIGMVFVIVAGHIDLSVGSVLGLCGGVLAILQSRMGWGDVPTLAVVILMGIVIGAWHGYWVAYRKVPAFIVTLGGYLMFRGMLLGLTKSVSISLSSPFLKAIGQSYLPKEIGMVFGVVAVIATIILILRGRASREKYNLEVPPMYQSILKICLFSIFIIGFVLVMNDYEGIPIPVIIVLCLTLIFNFLAIKTKFGRSVYAIGGNPEAAMLSGINNKKYTMLVFIISGLLSAVAGAILTGRLNAATSNAGSMAEMDAIAACVIGGTSMTGGVGSIPFALIGALVMTSLDNGMSLLNTESFWQQIIKGLILVLAVWVDMSTKNNRK